MRRLLIPSALSLVAGVVPLVAAPPPAIGAQTYRLTFSGEIAFGEWSTCPTWRPGAHCLFTQVIAGDARDLETNDFLDPTRRGEFLHSSEPSVVLRHFWFDVERVDGELIAVPTKESFGGIGVPGFPGSAGNPVVRVDTRLRTATVRATDIRMHTTDYTTPEGSEWWESASVATRWTGTGPLDRIREGANWWSDRRMGRESTTGWQRDVRATSTDPDAPVAGVFLGGYLLHAVQRESSGYKGPVGGPASAAVATVTTGIFAAAPTLGRSSSVTSHGEAFWTTCPDPQPGDRCRDALVVYDAVTPSPDGPAAVAWLSVYDYDVAAVEDGWVDMRNVVSVDAMVPEPTLVAPRDLSTATVGATGVAAEVCNDGEDCTSTTVSFDATWTGLGPSRAFASRSKVWGDWGREWVRVAGHSRDATATLTVSGLPGALHMNGTVTGTPLPAWVSTSTERRLTHLAG